MEGQSFVCILPPISNIRFTHICRHLCKDVGRTCWCTARILVGGTHGTDAAKFTASLKWNDQKKSCSIGDHIPRWRKFQGKSY